MAKKYKNVRERNGKYYYRYSIVDEETGKRIQKETKGFASAREAENEGIRIRAQQLDGSYVDEKDILFVDWAKRWIEIYAATGKVKNKTVDIRRDSLRIPKTKFRNLKLKEISRLRYQEMLNGMKDEGLSKNTITLTHITCGMLFKKAIVDGIIKNSPVIGAEVPAFPQTVEQLEAAEDVPRYLEKEELALLLKTARESNDAQGYHALFILAYTGLRIGELCTLKESDIDEINKTMSITKTLYTSKGIKAYTLNTPKTKSSIRKIDISDAVLSALKKQESWRKEYRMSERKRYYEKEKFIFINNKKLPGYPAAFRQFQDFMHEMLIRANLPATFTPHSLRHTYVSLMAEAGVELSVIQMLLGHKDDRVTKNIYHHVTKARKKASVEKFDNLMKDLL